MNVDKLKEKLADIDVDTLRDFILDLYLRYPELSDKIEALTLVNDPVAQVLWSSKSVQLDRSLYGFRRDG